MTSLHIAEAFAVFVFIIGFLALYIDLRIALILIKKIAAKISGKTVPQTPLFKRKSDKILAIAAVTVTMLAALCSIDAFLIEPYHLDVNLISLPSSSLPRGKTIKIAHITDTHMEKALPLHKEIITELQKFSPDLIVLTGDYMNHSKATKCFEEFAAALPPIAPTYAIDGNWDEERISRKIFPRTGVCYMDGEIKKILVKDTPICLIGTPFNGYYQWKEAEPEIPTTGTLNIVLTHSPDLIPLAAKSGKAHFYFCGHSHGGQVRLPFYGALVTLCDTGKKYEMGLYHVENMFAYTNRGVGMEGGMAPRVRFLCPPEIALFTISGTEGN